MRDVLRRRRERQGDGARCLFRPDRSGFAARRRQVRGEPFPALPTCPAMSDSLWLKCHARVCLVVHGRRPQGSRSVQGRLGRLGRSAPTEKGATPSLAESRWVVLCRFGTQRDCCGILKFFLLLGLLSRVSDARSKMFDDDHGLLLLHDASSDAPPLELEEAALLSSISWEFVEVYFYSAIYSKRWCGRLLLPMPSDGRPCRWMRASLRAHSCPGLKCRRRFSVAIAPASSLQLVKCTT